MLILIMITLMLLQSNWSVSKDFQTYTEYSSRWSRISNMIVHKYLKLMIRSYRLHLRKRSLKSKVQTNYVRFYMKLYCYPCLKRVVNSYMIDRIFTYFSKKIGNKETLKILINVVKKLCIHTLSFWAAISTFVWEPFVKRVVNSVVMITANDGSWTFQGCAGVETR